MTTQEIIKYLEMTIQEHNEMVRFLNSKGETERAKVWLHGVVSLEEVLYHIKDSTEK